jgi:hypothetical protein
MKINVLTILAVLLVTAVAVNAFGPGYAARQDIVEQDGAQVFRPGNCPYAEEGGCPYAKEGGCTGGCGGNCAGGGCAGGCGLK